MKRSWILIVEEDVMFGPLLANVLDDLGLVVGVVVDADTAVAVARDSRARDQSAFSRRSRKGSMMSIGIGRTTTEFRSALISATGWTWRRKARSPALNAHRQVLPDRYAAIPD